jgi:probable HAF family extracellular repeat protein
VLSGCCDTQWGADINDAGTIVGTTQVSQIVGNRGFVATGTSMVTLPILPAGDTEFHSGAVAINNAGQIAGYSPSGIDRHAVIWNAGVVQDLGTLGGTNSQAIDINASGQVIGSSQIAGDAATHYFLWSSATGMQDLNVAVDASITSVVEINDAGQISGTYTTTGGQSHAFLYTPGSGLRDLGTLGGTTSVPTGLNNAGQVVGTSTTGRRRDPRVPLDADRRNGGHHRRHRNHGRASPQRQPADADRHRFDDGASELLHVGHSSARPAQLHPDRRDAPPVAAFTWSCARKQCTFDASGSTDDNGIVSYAWDLDRDRGNDRRRGVVVKTTYAKGGSHDVVLTVTDAKGQTASVTHTVTP